MGHEKDWIYFVISGLIFMGLGTSIGHSCSEFSYKKQNFALKNAHLEIKKEDILKMKQDCLTQNYTTNEYCIEKFESNMYLYNLISIEAKKKKDDLE